MQSRTIVLALVAAILLAAVAMLVISLPRGPVAGRSVPLGDRILDLDVGRIAAVRVTGGGRTDVIRPGAAPGSWELLPAGDDKHPWLLNAGSVRGMFRLIAEMRATAEPAAGAAIEPGGVTVEFELEGGKRQAVRLSPRTLAGQGLVAVPDPASADAKAERLALVPDALHGVFAGQGVRGWREKLLLPGVAGAAAQVRLVNRSGGLALSKGVGRWSLSEPVAAAADPAAVLRLLTALEGLSAVRFYDEALAETTTGLDNPAARIIVELQAGPGKTVTREVSIGGPADGTGRNVFATTDNGRTIVALDATALSQLSLDVAKFLLPGAVAIAPADVGMVVVTGASAGGAAGPVAEQGWRRTSDGWVELRPGGQEVLLRANDAAVVTGLLSFLHGAAPAAISIDKPDGYVALATVRLSGLNLEIAEEVEAGTRAAGGLVVRSGRIYRAYAAAPAALERLLGPALPPAKTATNPQAVPPEINK